MSNVVPVVPVTTQQVFPWRAAVRTFIQTWVPAIFSAVVVIPQVIEIILEEVTKRQIVLPGWVFVTLIGIATICSAISAIIARVMGIRSVDKALAPIGISSAPATNVIEPKH